MRRLGGASGFRSLSLGSTRSEKFIVPSLRRTMFALRPEILSVSSAISPDKSGITRTATSAESSETKSVSLPGSLSVVLPSARPATGNSFSFGSPSIFRLRFFSCMALSRRALTNLPSTISSTAATATSASATTPARLYDSIFIAFIAPPCPCWRCRMVRDPWPHVGLRKRRGRADRRSRNRAGRP